MATLVGTTQSVAKDCVVGDRNMNRYLIYDGLRITRRIDALNNYDIAGVRAASQPTSVTAVGTAGNLTVDRYYAWVAVYASSRYTRPVSAADGSSNYTRGNPSDAATLQTAITAANRSVDIVVPCISQTGITHVLLYRSLAAESPSAAAAGPFYYATQGLNSQTAASVTINDGVSDGSLGLQVERDNFKPKAYRYAVNVLGYIFQAGNFPRGSGYTCTVESGSSIVTASGDIFYDGIEGWLFRLLDDNSGGVDDGGLYYANYRSANSLTLIDQYGNPTTYDGPNAGSGRTFTVHLSGNVLQWSKYGEPEAVPTDNLINFEGDIMGIAQMPNQPLVVVWTDKPAVHVFDMNLIGTETFKNKHTISTEFTTSSHYSLVGVEGRLRGICQQKKCIVETDGTTVRDITSGEIPRIFDYLSQDVDDQRNWHAAYDQAQKLYGAFVTYRGAQRICDYSICQYVRTGSWFFEWEKDLLSTGEYIDPDTGEQMVFGGTEGMASGLGGVWGRIWSPNVYDDWIPDGTLLSGTINNVVDATTFDVNTSSGNLATAGSALIGRWVLICNSNDEYAQLGYINENTASRIVVSGVLGGLSSTEFSPVPVAGWKFYLGLIEMRWGPKRFEFGDPEVEKKILEFWASMENMDDTNLPFVRLYRGYETGYDSQMALVERVYLDKTGNQSLEVSKFRAKLEATPRWGVAVYDRCYNEVKFHSFSIVMNKVL